MEMKILQKNYIRNYQLKLKNGRGHILQFPITVRNELPEKSIRSFKTWVSENENNPPEIDTSFRCTQSSV